MTKKLLKHNGKYITINSKPIIADYIGIDTMDATATSDKIIEGYTAYVQDNRVTGTLKDNQSFTESIRSKDNVVNIPEGYHDGTGNISIALEERNKLIAENIKFGINILGQDGNFTADGTAVASDILKDKIAYVNGEKIVGTHTDIEGVSKVDGNAIEITDTLDYIDVYGQQEIYCYEEGTKYIYGANDEPLLELYADDNNITYVSAPNLSSDNIREDVTILGVKGTYNNAIQGVEYRDNYIYISNVQADYIYVQNNTPVSITGSGYVDLADCDREIEVGENGVVSIHTIDGGIVTASQLEAQNIKDGVSILGVWGTYKGSILTDSGTITLEKVTGGEGTFTLDTSEANISMIVFTIGDWANHSGEDPNSSTSYLEFTFSSNQFINISTNMFHNGYSIVMYKKNCFLFDDDNNYIDRYEIHGDSLPDTEHIIIRLYSNDVEEESLYLNLSYSVYNFT